MLRDCWNLCNNRVFNCICKRRHVTWCLQHLQHVNHVRHTNGQVLTHTHPVCHQSRGSGVLNVQLAVVQQLKLTRNNTTVDLTQTLWYVTVQGVVKVRSGVQSVCWHSFKTLLDPLLTWDTTPMSPHDRNYVRTHGGVDVLEDDKEDLWRYTTEETRDN